MWSFLISSLSRRLHNLFTLCLVLYSMCPRTQPQHSTRNHMLELGVSAPENSSHVRSYLSHLNSYRTLPRHPGNICRSRNMPRFPTVGPYSSHSITGERKIENTLCLSVLPGIYIKGAVWHDSVLLGPVGTSLSAWYTGGHLVGREEDSTPKSLWEVMEWRQREQLFPSVDSSSQSSKVTATPSFIPVCYHSTSLFHCYHKAASKTVVWAGGGSNG